MQYLPLNAFDYIFQNNKIELHSQNPDELIFYFENQNSIDIDKCTAISKELIEIGVLIEYLRQEGLIVKYSIGTATSQNSSIAYQHSNYQHPLSVEIPSKIGEILLSCATTPIFVTENLIELVNNDFKTYEDISLEEARKQTEKAKIQTDNSFKAIKIAFASIIVSLVTFLISLLKDILL